MVSGGNASSLPLVGGKPEPTIKELSSPGRRASNLLKHSHVCPPACPQHAPVVVCVHRGPSGLLPTSLAERKRGVPCV